jgi:CHAT domain-containing protein/tetratricopeptide (TPR) repeat protein
MKFAQLTSLLLFLWFFCHVSEAQELNLAVYDSIMSSENNDQEKTKKIEMLLEKNKEISSSDLASIYYQFSKWFWIRKNRDEKKAIFYAKKERQLRSEALDLNPDHRKRNLYNLGFFYRKSTIPDYTNALICFNDLIELSKPFEKRLGRAYRESAIIYNKLGDFQRALDYFESSERVFKKIKAYRDLLITYMNTSATYSDLEDAKYFDAFMENHQKIEALKKEIVPSSTNQAILFINQGYMYSTVKQYDEADECYKKALELVKENKDSVLIFKTLNDLGVLRKKQRKFEVSEELHRQSLQFAQSNPLNESMVFDNLGELFLEKGDASNALIQFQKALTTVLSQDDLPFEELPDFKAIEISPHKRFVLIFLIDKMDAWLTQYQKTSNKEDLKQAGNTMSLVDKLIDLLYFESREVLSKLFWRKQGAELYVKAVQIYYELNEPEQAFYYMEKNKGLLLLENITNTKARQYGGIPSEIIDREFEMASEIKDLQYHLMDANQAEEKERLRNLLFAQKSNYQRFIDSLETRYPDYYSFKKKLDILPLSRFKKNLGDNEVILEYILGQNNGYVLYVSNTETSFQKITKVSELDAYIQQYHQLISKPFVSKDDQLKYEELSAKLVQHIFPLKDVNAKLLGKKLNIVLDRALQLIPFETLQFEVENKEVYLIRESEIVYNYSLSLQEELNTFETDTKDDVVEFTIEEFQDQYLPTLSGAGFTKIRLNFDHTTFTKDKATKAAFLNEYDKSSVVFISTHGGVDKDQPWLGFYDEKLTLDELYFTPTHKDMVVLSACKTSVGEYQEGESVFNISRGFINSGAKSVISTLWNINEKSSNTIINDFFENMNAGQTKSTALRNAKLSYLDVHKNTSLASPYYWSSIVLTGNTDPLINSNDTYYLGAIAAFLVLFILLYLRRKKSATQK